MRSCIIQPPYSRDLALSDEYFAYKLKLLDECDEDTDIIVLPEYSDVPCATATMEETLHYHNKYINLLLEMFVKELRLKMRLSVQSVFLQEISTLQRQHWFPVKKVFCA